MSKLNETGLVDLEDRLRRAAQYEDGEEVVLIASDLLQEVKRLRRWVTFVDLGEYDKKYHNA